MRGALVIAPHADHLAGLTSVPAAPVSPSGILLAASRTAASARFARDEGRWSRVSSASSAGDRDSTRSPAPAAVLGWASTRSRRHLAHIMKWWLGRAQTSAWFWDTYAYDHYGAGWGRGSAGLGWWQDHPDAAPSDGLYDPWRSPHGPPALSRGELAGIRAAAAAVDEAARGYYYESPAYTALEDMDLTAAAESPERASAEVEPPAAGAAAALAPFRTPDPARGGVPAGSDAGGGGGGGGGSAPVPGGAAAEVFSAWSEASSGGAPWFVRAFAEYAALDEGELSLALGEIVRVVSTDGSGWWEGRSHTGEGWFPATFVETVDAETAGYFVTPASLPAAAAGADAEASMEWSASLGDAADVFASDDGGLWKYDWAAEAWMQQDAVTGVWSAAPAAAAGDPFAVAAAASSGAGGEGYVRAHSAYARVDEGELGLAVGDVVWVREMDGSGWWHGVNVGSGAEGWFPSTFVEWADAGASGASAAPAPAEPVRSSSESEFTHPALSSYDWGRAPPSCDAALVTPVMFFAAGARDEGANAGAAAVLSTMAALAKRLGDAGSGGAALAGALLGAALGGPDRAAVGTPLATAVAPAPAAAAAAEALGTLATGGGAHVAPAGASAVRGADSHAESM